MSNRNLFDRVLDCILLTQCHIKSHAVLFWKQLKFIALFSITFSCSAYAMSSVGAALPRLISPGLVRSYPSWLIHGSSIQVRLHTATWPFTNMASHMNWWCLCVSDHIGFSAPLPSAVSKAFRKAATFSCDRSHSGSGSRSGVLIDQPKNWRWWIKTNQLRVA